VVIALSILCLLACANAFNLIDIMDGLSGDRDRRFVKLIVAPPRRQL
jgi:hypothetical protein